MIDIYAELAEPSRRRILAELRGGPRTVSQIVEATGLRQPNVSNHLSRMRLRDVVQASKAGRQVYYAYASAEVEAVVAAALSESVRPPCSIDLCEMAKEYALLAVAGDEAGCAAVVDRAIATGSGLLCIYQDLLAKGMNIVGKMWLAGKVDIGQEHAATEITERALGRIALRTCPHKKQEGVAVLGCAEGCRHSLGLRMIADFLRLNGWQAVYLGADVPCDAFVAAVRRHQPQLVLLSCGACQSAQQTVATIRSLRQEPGDFKIGLGGWAVTHRPELFKNAEPDFVATDLRGLAAEYALR